MFRLTEIVLMFAPFAAFAVWRVMDTRGGPSNLMLLGAAAAMALLIGALIWLIDTEGLRRGDDYVPARLDHGQVVPGHAGPPP